MAEVSEFFKVLHNGCHGNLHRSCSDINITKCMRLPWVCWATSRIGKAKFIENFGREPFLKVVTSVYQEGNIILK